VEHPETLIRRSVATLLIAAATVAGSRVFPSRKTNFRNVELPAIAIYMLSTDSELRDEAPRNHKRTTTMVVELRLESGANIDEVDEPLDAFRLEVENVLDFDRHLLDEADNLTPTGTDQISDPSGGRVVAVAAMSYVVEYFQCTPTPASAVPLEKAKSTFNLNNAVDSGNQVSDCVELEGDQT